MSTITQVDVKSVPYNIHRQKKWHDLHSFHCLIRNALPKSTVLFIGKQVKSQFKKRTEIPSTVVSLICL